MKDLVFLDSNVLLYAANANPGEREKHRTAVALVEGGPFATSGQVLAEFYSIATSVKGRLTADQALAWIEKLSTVPCVAVDAALVKAGAAYARRYKISYWDGAIIAAAEKAGAFLLFTEDLNDGQKYGPIEARNPFETENR
ncbi:MAG: PIN domain-containing protein [Parvularculaceae bacterium]|nr:PIN domain-containing protein [Parvularculaceae bacterium]